MGTARPGLSTTGKAQYLPTGLQGSSGNTPSQSAQCLTTGTPDPATLGGSMGGQYPAAMQSATPNGRGHSEQVAARCERSSTHPPQRLSLWQNRPHWPRTASASANCNGPGNVGLARQRPAPAGQPIQAPAATTARTLRCAISGTPKGLQRAIRAAPLAILQGYR